ncbi:MAG: hypothetical protein ACYSUA_08265, partial [Planctomycetota bacterium]
GTEYRLTGGHRAARAICGDIIPSDDTALIRRVLRHIIPAAPVDKQSPEVRGGSWAGFALLFRPLAVSTER